MLGTFSIIVLYWGYIDVQSAVRVNFGISLPFPPQDYYMAGLSYLPWIVPASAIGMALAVLPMTKNWNLKRHGNTAIILGALLLSQGLNVWSVFGHLSHGWALVLNLSSTFVAAFGLIYVWMLALELASVQTLLKQQKERLERVAGGLDREKKDLDELVHHTAGDNRHDIGVLIKLKGAEDIAQNADEVKDLRTQVERHTRSIRFSWYAVVPVLALMCLQFLQSTGFLVKGMSDTRFEGGGNQFPVVSITTRTAIPELTAEPGSLTYRLELIAKGGDQVFLYRRESGQAFAIPASEVLRIVSRGEN